MTNDMKAIILVGLPGSGKSTYSREINKQYNYEVISTDVEKRIEKCLEEGRDFIYDGTNANHKKRRIMIEKFQNKGVYVKVIFVGCAIPELLARNIKREPSKRLPWDKLVQLIKAFHVPTKWEGMDELCFEINEPDVNNYFYSTIGFDQKSKWHNEYLHGHIRTVIGYITYNCNDLSENEIEILESVARWHDFGKLFTQSEKDDGYMSYHGHENVSAYIYATSNFWQSGFLLRKGDHNVLALIFFHMQIGNAKTEKAKNKLIGYIGEDNFRLLERFHEADKFRR